MGLSFGMNIHGSFKFPSHHVSPVTCIKGGFGERRLMVRRIPSECAKPASITLAIATTRPGRFVARLGKIIPDQRLSVSGLLINSVTERDIRKR